MTVARKANGEKRTLRSRTTRAFNAVRNLRAAEAVTSLPRLRGIQRRAQIPFLRQLGGAARLLLERKGRKRAIARRIVGATLSMTLALSVAPMSYLVATLWPGGNSLGSTHTMDLIGNAPSNAMSRWMGKVAASESLPYVVHQRLIKMVIQTYGIDISEVEKPLSEYPTVQAFFSRRLVAGARPAHPHSCLVSPCDGELLQVGKVTDNDMIVQVKGDEYSLSDLLKTDSRSFGVRSPGTTRWYFLFHLRPKDYHRFHSPAEWTVHEAVHIPGTLHPVTITANKWIPGLFAKNERVSVIGEWEHGTIGFVPVGATCVGSISLGFDENIKTNKTSSITNLSSLFRFANGSDTSSISGPAKKTIEAREEAIREIIPEVDTMSAGARRRVLQDVFPEPGKKQFRYGGADEPSHPTLTKGGEMGWFNWGSAIAIIVDVPENLGIMVRPHDEVRVGDPLFSW